jgi:hypothetical protein
MIRMMTTTAIVTTADSKQIACTEAVGEAEDSMEDSKAIKSNTRSHSEAIEDNTENYIKKNLSEGIEKQGIEKHTEEMAISIVKINTQRRDVTSAERQAVS